jgi:hypothetical protein
MSMKQHMVIAAAAVAGLTVAVPRATAQPDACQERGSISGTTDCDCPQGYTAHKTDHSANCVLTPCRPGWRETQGEQGWGVCMPISPWPASVPAGVTEASICAEMMAVITEGTFPHSSGYSNPGIEFHLIELDKLKAKGMTESDADDAIDAAIWHVCPNLHWADRTTA